MRTKKSHNPTVSITHYNSDITSFANLRTHCSAFAKGVIRNKLPNMRQINEAEKLNSSAYCSGDNEDER
jgi:hypothetical protein